MENTERGRVTQTKAKGELRRPGKQGLADCGRAGRRAGENRGAEIGN